MSKSMSARSGSFVTLTVIFSASLSSHAGTGAGAVLLDALFDLVAVRGADGDLVALFHEVGGDVHGLAVHGKVTVQHQLAGFLAAHRKARAVDDIVQSAFKDPKQILTGDAGFALGHFKVMGELALRTP